MKKFSSFSLTIHAFLFWQLVIVFITFPTLLTGMPVFSTFGAIFGRTPVGSITSGKVAGPLASSLAQLTNPSPKVTVTTTTTEASRIPRTEPPIEVTTPRPPPPTTTNPFEQLDAHLTTSAPSPDDGEVRSTISPDAEAKIYEKLVSKGFKFETAKLDESAEKHKQEGHVSSSPFKIR